MSKVTPHANRLSFFDDIELNYMLLELFGMNFIYS
jgi:hypothetical protein